MDSKDLPQNKILKVIKKNLVKEILELMKEKFGPNVQGYEGHLGQEGGESNG